MTSVEGLDVKISARPKRSMRRIFTPHGERRAGQCDCKAFVVLTDKAWFGEEPMPAHREWRPTLMHLFAEGRFWLLEQRTYRARGICWLLGKCERYVLSVPCEANVTHNFEGDWPASGLAAFGPRPTTKSADAGATVIVNAGNKDIVEDVLRTIDRAMRSKYRGHNA